MGGIQSQRMAITFADTFDDMQKRTLQQETRPQIRTAADLLGPGIAPYAVQIQDWDDDVTTFNGIFYSEPGSLNGPDSTSFWMGTSHATPDGFGVQRVVQYAGLTGDVRGEEWERRFFDPGTSDRAYSAWALIGDTRYIGEAVMTFSETPPNSRYLFANGRSLLRTDYPELFVVWGLLHGYVDDTHFNIPDMRGRMPQGSNGAAAGAEPGNVDTLALADRDTRHNHVIPPQVLADSQNTAATGTAGRLQGSPGNITHNHGGATGESAHSEFPHIRVAYHVRVLP